MQLFEKKTPESSVVYHSSLHSSNSQETFVQEPPTDSQA